MVLAEATDILRAATIVAISVLVDLTSVARRVVHEVSRNPNGLVPTIDHGDIRLWESNVIVRYLAHKSGDGRLYSADTKTRFGAERWMDWQATVFWRALRPLFIELVRTQAAKRDEAVIQGANICPEPLFRYSMRGSPTVGSPPATRSPWAIFPRL